MKLGKKLVAVALALVMVIGMLPTTVFAASFDLKYCANCKGYTIFVNTKTYSATCEKGGYEVWDCGVCGNSVDKPTGSNPLGHKLRDDGWTVTEPTCTAAGSKTQVCGRENCNKTVTEDIPATGHSYESVVISATCTEAGKTTYTCENCGDTYDVAGDPATGHSYGTGVVTSATCTEAGKTTYTCENCGDTYDDPISATGHQWGEWEIPEASCVAGEKTRTCSACGEVERNTVDATGEHTWDEGVVTKSATCTDDGIMTYTCDVCGASYTGTIEAKGHQLTSVEETPATCTADGKKAHDYCEACEKLFQNGAEVTDEDLIIEMLPHDYSEYKTIREATCTKPGEKAKVCNNCGFEAFNEEIPSKGHSLIGMYDENGHWQYCENCDYATKSEDHVMGEWITDEDDPYYQERSCECGYSERQGMNEPPVDPNPGETDPVDPDPNETDDPSNTDPDPTPNNPADPSNPSGGNGGNGGSDTVIDDADIPLAGGVDGEVELGDEEVPLAGLMTRAAFVNYLWEYEGKPLGEAPTFLDVPADHEYYAAIGWAQANHIAYGYDEEYTSFRPDDLVVAGHARLFLERYAAFKGITMPELITLIGLDDAAILDNAGEVLNTFPGPLPEADADDDAA